MMRIKDIVKIQAGFAFKGQHFTNKGTPVIKIKNISKNGNVNTEDTDYIDLKDYPNLPQSFFLKNSDWIVAMTGAEIGKVGRINSQKGNTFLLNQRVGKIESPKQYNNDYIGYLLSTPKYQKKILDSSHGSAQANISSSIIEDFPIPNTTETDRKRIANILSSFDNKIEQLKKENNILENIAQSIFKEWFVKYNFPNNDGKPYKDTGGKMIDSELGLIPDGWRVGKLGEICELKSGFAFKGEDFVKNSSTEVVKIKDILGQGQIDTSNLSYVSNSVIEQNSKLSKFILSEGDILIAMSGNTTGKIGLMPKTEKNIFLNQRVGKIFFKNLAYYSFVYNFLMTNNYEQKILNMGYGSAQPNINPEQIAAIRIVLPNTTILQKYKTFSTYFIKKQLHNLRLIALYKHTRNNLLNKLY